MTTLLSLGATTVAAYRLRSGDETTAASAVSAALLEGESMLEEHLRRRLPSVERTDSFRIHPDGRLYPDAWPITASSLTIDGRSLLGGTVDVGAFVGLLGSGLQQTPRATVTWTGGFTAATLPPSLANAIYDLGRALLADTPAIPAGYSTATVGDVSVSGGTGGGSGDVDALVPGLAARVSRYMNRWAA